MSQIRRLSNSQRQSIGLPPVSYQMSNKTKSLLRDINYCTNSLKVLGKYLDTTTGQLISSYISILNIKYDQDVFNKLQEISLDVMRYLEIRPNDNKTTLSLSDIKDSNRTGNRGATQQPGIFLSMENMSQTLPAIGTNPVPIMIHPPGHSGHHTVIHHPPASCPPIHQHVGSGHMIYHPPASCPPMHQVSVQNPRLETHTPTVIPIISQPSHYAEFPPNGSEYMFIDGQFVQVTF